MRAPRVLALFSAQTVLLAWAAAEAPKLWGGLAPGPYAVGFRTEWRQDPTRRYERTLSHGGRYANGGKASRPILLNIWYPAAPAKGARQLRHRDYLDLPLTRAGSLRLKALANDLRTYEYEIVTQEFLGKKPNLLSPAEKQAIDAVLDARTAAILEAPPVKNRRFPVVVYHAGAGSSYEDNAVMLEYLASHGFVVVGSAFLKGDGSSFNVDGFLDSIQDLDFLIHRAKELPYADMSRIAVMGHSAGAQAAMMYAARPSVATDALVILDTTQDYYSMNDPRWSTLLPYLKENGKHLRAPMLVAAQPNAYFQLCDSLTGSDRTYFTYTSFDHNNFIAQGILSTELKRRLEGNKPPSEDTKNAVRARRSFHMLAEVVKAYLDTHLKGKAFRSAAQKAVVFDAQFVSARRGVSGPPPYNEASGRPPTPRELRAMIDASPEAALKTIETFANGKPEPSFFDFTFVTSVLFDLVKRGRAEDAKRVYAAYGEESRSYLKGFMSVADAFGNMGRKAYAIEALRTILAIRPDWPGAREALRKLEGK